MYDCPCPDPGDKEGWRQWNKCHLIAAAVALVVLGVIFILSKL
jgi:hypothetical protein